jgi:hypothetical protein
VKLSALFVNDLNSSFIRFLSASLKRYWYHNVNEPLKFNTVNAYAMHTYALHAKLRARHAVNILNHERSHREHRYPDMPTLWM